jgi:hypothetical protein
MAKTGKLAPVNQRQQEQYRPHMKGFDNRHCVLVNLLSVPTLKKLLLQNLLRTVLLRTVLSQILLLQSLLLIAGTALAQSGNLPDYERNEWRHWEDFDGDCQNTRQELLISQSQIAVSFASPRACTVALGQWLDPYTGSAFSKASDVDIDHVIPLQYAHDHGGALWSPLLKKLFANDPDNLLIVDDGENQRKGAKGPAQYLPRLQYRCEYVRRWQQLTEKYELQLARQDLQTLTRITRECTT